MSTVITADQAFDLADGLRRSGEALTRRLLSTWAELSPADRARMQQQAGELLTAAITTRVRAMGLVLDGVEASVTALKRATSRANAAIRSVETARQATRIAAGLLALAGAIAAQNPVAVAGALASLLDELES